VLKAGERDLTRRCLDAYGNLEAENMEAQIAKNCKGDLRPRIAALIFYLAAVSGIEIL